ncbi:hypothetical protein U9M48_009883 [Paspalum notatum var. saurae]|uniref:Uncharacterized protein n=1 Tax=Paspalum notatum var. saurae TaxID=547442 RepID=A0AAQ3STS8_PASNO
MSLHHRRPARPPPSAPASSLHRSTPPAKDASLYWSNCCFNVYSMYFFSFDLRSINYEQETRELMFMWDFRDEVYAILERERNNESVLAKGHGNI